MQDQIQKEIKELKSTLAKLIGTADLPPGEQFSEEALNKAAKAFQKLSIERGEWVEESNIDKCIKGAPYRAGKYIRKEFAFANYFKRGNTSYYNKKDLIALGIELKKRNVDLKRYIEFKEDQLKFEKYVFNLSQKGKEKQKNKPFKIKDSLKDITTSPPLMPSPDIIKDDLKKLQEEFFQNKYSEYIDIYGGNYAMTKFVYQFEKYINPELRKKCRKWCDNFNYANHALEEVTRKKEVFVPVPESEMIQL